MNELLRNQNNELSTMSKNIEQDFNVKLLAFKDIVTKEKLDAVKKIIKKNRKSDENLIFEI